MFLILVKMTPDLLKVAEFKVIRSWTFTDIWFSVSLHLSLTRPPPSCSEMDLFENERYHILTPNTFLLDVGPE